MDNVNFILNNINKYGKISLSNQINVSQIDLSSNQYYRETLYLFKPANVSIEKVSYTYPYDRTFGNPFTTTTKYNIKIIKNNTVYFSYKKTAYLIETCCKNESMFLAKVIGSKLYRSLIIKANVPIINLKFPEYNSFHDHTDINKFLIWYFHL